MLVRWLDDQVEDAFEARLMEVVVAMIQDDYWNRLMMAHVGLNELILATLDHVDWKKIWKQVFDENKRNRNQKVHDKLKQMIELAILYFAVDVAVGWPFEEHDHVEQPEDPSYPLNEHQSLMAYHLTLLMRGKVVVVVVHHQIAS